MNRREIFSNIYRNGVWNDSRSDIPKSGPGSSLANTIKFREFFDTFCENHTIESVLDIGCGDLTWMPLTKTFQTKKYTGIDIVQSLIDSHRKSGLKATMTAVYPPGKFGAINVKNSKVNSFREKPKGDGGLINGGFFVLSPLVLDLIKSDSTVWEQGPLEFLAKDGQLGAYEHRGFWQPMDTLRDKNHLEELWSSGDAPWKMWK